jgi:hypothetical protein
MGPLHMTYDHARGGWVVTMQVVTCHESMRMALSDARADAISAIDVAIEELNREAAANATLEKLRMRNEGLEVQIQNVEETLIAEQLRDEGARAAVRELTKAFDLALSKVELRARRTGVRADMESETPEIEANSTLTHEQIDVAAARVFDDDIPY